MDASQFLIQEIPPKDFVPFKRAVHKYLISEDAPFAPFLSKRKDHSIPLVLGAFLNDVPIGIVVAFYYKIIHRALIQTLFVKEEYRHQGLGSTLLQRLEIVLKMEGIHTVTVNYEASLPTSLYFEKILKKQHFGPSTISYQRYLFDSATFRPSWLTRVPTKLPKDFSLFSWAALKKEDRKELEFQYKQRSYTADIYPFFKEELIEPSNSLGLRYKGKVIGWIITHRIRPDLIRYTALYLRNEFRLHSFGLAPKLLIESIKRHVFAKNPVKYGSCEIANQPQNPHWSRFIKHKLIPHSIEIQEVKSTYKNLSASVHPAK